MPVIGPDKYGDSWMWTRTTNYSSEETAANSAGKALFTTLQSTIPGSYEDFLLKLLDMLKGYGSLNLDLLNELKGKSYSEAVAIINAYINKIQGALNQNAAASQAIDKEIDAIKNDPRYTQAQKDQMIKDLNAEKTNLATDREYLGKYLDELKQLKLKDNGSGGWSWQVPPPLDFGDAEKTANNLCKITYQTIEKLAGATPWWPHKTSNSSSYSPDSGESLPDRFKHAILDHFMKEQEKFLMAMAALLYFDNMGSEMGNTLLGKLSDFGGAQFNYNFSGT